MPSESVVAEDEIQHDPSEETVVVLDDLEGSLDDAIDATIVCVRRDGSP